MCTEWYCAEFYRRLDSYKASVVCCHAIGQYVLRDLQSQFELADQGNKSDSKASEGGSKAISMDQYRHPDRSVSASGLSESKLPLEEDVCRNLGEKLHREWSQLMSICETLMMKASVDLYLAPADLSHQHILPAYRLHPEKASKSKSLQNLSERVVSKDAGSKGSKETPKEIEREAERQRNREREKEKGRASITYGEPTHKLIPVHTTHDVLMPRLFPLKGNKKGEAWLRPKLPNDVIDELYCLYNARRFLEVFQPQEKFKPGDDFKKHVTENFRALWTEQKIACPWQVLLLPEFKYTETDVLRHSQVYLASQACRSMHPLSGGEMGSPDAATSSDLRVSTDPDSSADPTVSGSPIQRSVVPPLHGMTLGRSSPPVSPRDTPRSHLVSLMPEAQRRNNLTAREYTRTYLLRKAVPVYPLHAVNSRSAAAGWEKLVTAFAGSRYFDGLDAMIRAAQDHDYELQDFLALHLALHEWGDLPDELILRRLLFYIGKTRFAHDITHIQKLLILLYLAICMQSFSSHSTCPLSRNKYVHPCIHSPCYAQAATTRVMLPPPANAS